MSYMTDTDTSLPDIPEDISRGSSVSSAFVSEYDEILRYAIVAPKFQVGEDVYKKLQQTEGEQSHSSSNKELSDSSSIPEINIKTSEEIKVNEAKKAATMKTKKKNLRFNIPNVSVLDTLLEYSDTPVKEKLTPKPQEQDDSATSTPESVAASPSVDKDLIRMDHLMEDWCLQLKRNVLAEIADMKMRQLQAEENAIHQLKSQHSAEMLRQTHEIENLKELLYTFEQNVKQKDELIKNLTDALAKQKDRSDKIRLFSMWKLKHSDERRSEFSSKMADKFYKKALAAKVWSGWRSVVESKWKQRVEKACQVKSQEICIKLTEDYEERLQALQRELSSARTEVSKMHHERDCYEENMKKAFMRGVCALNMEAMSMFKEPDDTDDNRPPTSSHYPCTTTPTVPTSSEATYPPANREEQPSKQQFCQGKKHVTFYQAGGVTNKNMNKTSTNKRNLHIKMTAKKDSNTTNKREGSSIHSSISSVKVERHVPAHEISHNKLTSNGLPQFNREQPCSRPSYSVPTVKIVE